MSERRRTRDLLLEYSMLPQPYATNLKSIYPLENLSLSILQQQLFMLARDNGFQGNITNFKEKIKFLLQDQQIVYENFSNFPSVGEKNKLYFDLTEKILYYWENEYIPINSTLIANTIIEGGEA